MSHGRVGVARERSNPMTRGTWVSFLFVAVAISACAKLEDRRREARDEEMALDKAEPAALVAAQSPALAEAFVSGARTPLQPMPPVPQQRKIIRNGNLSLEVDSVEESLEKVKSLVDSLGGYISNETVSEDQYSRKTGSITCRVPSEGLDRAVEQLKGFGKLEGVSISADDITDQYYDLEVRVANQKALEKRLLELLERETRKLSDLLEIERELARVRTDIDSMEGRKRLWDNQIAYSTLVVNVHEPLPIIAGDEGGAWRTLLRSLGEAGDNFVMTIAVIVSVTGAVIPVLVLALVTWWLWRVLRRPTNATQKADPGVRDESH